MSTVEASLARIVDRVGADRLATDPMLARGALKDLFPEDPRVVSLLTAGVEHGVLSALRDRDDRVPLSVLGPRLANQLRRDSGVSSTSARWVVGAWAAALGMLDRPLPEPPRDEAGDDATDLFTAPVAPTVRTAPVSADDVPTLVRPPADDVTTDSAAPIVTTVPGTTVIDADATVPRTSAVAGSPTADTVALVASDPMIEASQPDIHEAVTQIRSGGAEADPAPVPEQTIVLVQSTVPSPAEETRGGRPRRRTLLVGAALVVVLLLAGGIVALVLRPSSALAVSGSATNTAFTAGGSATTLSSGAAVPTGTTVEVRSGLLELRAGSSVLRLDSGARATVNGPDDVTVGAGRAFVLVDGTPITLRTAIGNVRITNGRALASCMTACTVTALDAGTTVTSGSTTRALQRMQEAGGENPSFVLADAIRADPWFTRNDSLDRQQGRSPSGLAGRPLTGTWLTSVTRPDLPFALTTTIALSPTCGDSGCTLAAVTRMSDGVPTSRITGTVRPLDADGSRLSIDYGSHTVRCHWVTGTKHGGGIDGRETVSDQLEFTGTGSAARVTGKRTTQYTATGDGCREAVFTSVKTGDIAGARGTTAQLTDSAMTDRLNLQRARLNYVADSGTGCHEVTSAPTAELQSDQRCDYAANGSGPTSVEYSVYNTSPALGAAYQQASKGLARTNTGDCATGPCEGIAPNGHGRFLLAEDGRGAVLITYDPRAANLLVIARGASMRGLSAWWSTQQRTPSVYQSTPIRRVGV